jgi:hypothetical protein
MVGLKPKPSRELVHPFHGIPTLSCAIPQVLHASDDPSPSLVISSITTFSSPVPDPTPTLLFPAWGSSLFSPFATTATDVWFFDSMA